MSDFELYALLAVALSLCIANWRAGLPVCLLIGFLQDPLRKITPGEPIIFTVLVGTALAATLVGAHLRHVPLNSRPLHAWNSVLRTPLKLFILVVVLQSLAGVARTGNPIIGGIGILTYLAPLPAVILGYQFSKSERDITKLVRFYLIIAILMVSGIYLSYAGIRWQALNAVGEGLYIYSVEEGRLDLFSGFLRSPEIAAWHGAASVCLLILLALAVKKNAILKWAAGFLVLYLMGALLLTGRRKFLVEIFLFCSIYALLLIWFHRKTIRSAVISRSAFLLAGGLLVGSVVYMCVASDVVATEMRPYYERGVSVRSDMTERVSVMTIESFQYVIAQNGLLGSGAGTGSQGAQYFGGGSDIVGAAAEGGLGKVLAELGIPGLALLMWLVISLARYVWSIILFTTTSKDVDPALSKIVFGLAAFLVTNGFVFVVAHQVFGDPFVLIVVGFFLGFVMAAPKMQKAAAAIDLASQRRREMKREALATS